MVPFFDPQPPQLNGLMVFFLGGGRYLRLMYDERWKDMERPYFFLLFWRALRGSHVPPCQFMCSVRKSKHIKPRGKKLTAPNQLEETKLYKPHPKPKLSSTETIPLNTQNQTQNQSTQSKFEKACLKHVKKTQKQNKKQRKPKGTPPS